MEQTSGQEDEEIIRPSKHEQEGFEWIDIGKRESNSGLNIGGVLLSFNVSLVGLKAALSDGRGFARV